MDPQELTQDPAEQEQPEIEEKKPLTVDLAAAEEDDDDDKAPVERERNPRRKSDWRKMKEEHAREMAELRTQLAEMRGHLTARRETPVVHVPAPAGDKPDPVKQQIRGVRDQQQALLTMIQNAQTEEDRRKFTEQYHDLDEQRIALISESRAPKRREAPEITPDTVNYMTLAGEFPEIYENDELRLEAQVEMAKLMRRHHKPRSLATAREACQRVAAANGIGRKIPAPTDTERSRYSSVPARGTGSNGASSSYQPNKYQLSMARAFTAHIPDLSDQERFIHWMRATKAKETGLL